MAATFAQSGNRSTSTSATSHTMASQSVSAVTNGIGFYAFLDTNSASDRLTGVTWGGVAMTRVATISYTVPYSYRIFLYAIEAPSTGTITITATTSVATNGVFWWFTVQDAEQEQPEASNTTTVTDNASPTISITTLTDNALVVAIGTPLTNSATPAGQSGTTLQQNFFNLQTTWTKPQATAGSNTSGIQNLTANSDTAIIACSVAPVGGGGGDTTKFFNLMS